MASSSVPCPCHGFFGNIELCPAVVAPGSKHPAWSKPAEAGGTFKGLMVNNSLTGQLEEFRPAHGNQVLWYTCGPTVYDACHMGHARAYLTLDILRRITEDYFGYDVMYHVNITDVDDKIILRARQEHLLKEWKAVAFAKQPPKEALAFVVAETTAALAQKRAKLAKSRAKLDVPLPEGSGSREQEDHAVALKGQSLKEEQLASLDVALATATTAAAAATAGGSDEAATAAAAALVAACGTELGELADARLGADVSEHAIFNAHSRKYEQSFFDDMEALGVRPPDVVTRVTEYVPQIVAFVAAIVAKGLAYASKEGSVYLSIEAFKAQGHTYRKLKPFAGDTSDADMAEGEGALGVADASEKQHPNDFALWKASKPGEPFWPSPWGQGRPGWHIECSVIASDILGPSLDVHAGGADLKFPHHDNELAQAEAFYGHSQWVNYFFHAGHLDIKGLKMSKSLKNFITIQQALEKHSARQIRLMFLLQPWDKGMNYSDQTMQDAKAKEALFRNFFGAVKAVLSEPAPAGSANSSAWLSKTVGWTNPAGPSTAAAAAAAGATAGGDGAGGASAGSGAASAEKALALHLSTCGDAVHAAFCRNFDTPAVILALCALVTEVNKYLSLVASNGSGKPAASLLRKCAAKVTSVLRLLGVVEGADDLGFPLSGLPGSGSGDGSGGASNGGGAEELLGPYLDAFRDFRHEVRGLMRPKASDPAAAEVLAACDRVRDVSLPPLGVRLEDLSGGGSRWKLDDPQVLLREMADKAEKEAEAKKAKHAKEVAKASKKWSDAAAAAIPPKDFFCTTRGAEFSAYDAEGLPTHAAAKPPPAPAASNEGGSAEGAPSAATPAEPEPLAKSALKKLQKALEKQGKDHEKVIAEAAAAGLTVEAYVETLAAALAVLQASE